MEIQEKKECKKTRRRGLSFDLALLGYSSSPSELLRPRPRTSLSSGVVGALLESSASLVDVIVLIAVVVVLQPVAAAP